jgi:hypothetical protein
MPQSYGKVNTFEPTGTAEAGNVALRTGREGTLWTFTSLEGNASAYEGSSFIARPTPAAGGTGTAMGIQTTFSDTANIALMLNNGDASKTYIPLYIKTRCTAAGTTTTSSEIAIEVDNTNRYSSGGSTMTPGCVNASASQPTSNATVRIGTLTAAAAGSKRAWITSFLIRQAAAPAWIVGDVDYYSFGGLGASTFPYNKLGQPIDTTASPGTIYSWPIPSCAIPPTGTLLVHIANVANATTAPSFEWEIGWIER